MKNQVNSLLFIVLLFVLNACGNNSQPTNENTSYDETGINNQQDSEINTNVKKSVSFSLDNKSFSYNNSNPNNLEVDIINSEKGSWLFSIAAENSEFFTEALINFSVQYGSIENAVGIKKTTGATIVLNTEKENSPFGQDAFFAREPIKFEITSIKKEKSDGGMGLEMDYYLLNGKFEIEFQSIDGTKTMQLKDGKFENLRLMNIKP